ncbi:MAG: metallophosphoesterase [Fibrobacteria bacterium]|nr:metallophosphoesterase [Fibrobacteria bacterium]
MKNKIFFQISLLFFLSVSFAGTENGRFTVAAWGDSRSNHGSSFSEISGYLKNAKGKTVDVHFHNGDFTGDGDQKYWDRSWAWENVREACVKDYFFMCPSNHDDDGPYQAELADILPSNGSNVFYYHQSWDIPGSKRKVHLLACDPYYWDQPVEDQLAYFEEELKKANAKPEDWIFGLWHPPSYAPMSYKYPQPTADQQKFIEFMIPRGGDFVLNGHAHIYRRTHILAKDGSRAETVEGPFSSYTSPDSSSGMVHIINGRGGTFSNNEYETWENHVFAPRLTENDAVGLLTIMEIDDNTVYMRTVEIGNEYEEADTLDLWTWTRGAPMPTDTATPVIETLQQDLPFSVYTHEQSIRIDIPFDTKYDVDIIDLKGNLQKSFYGNERTQLLWETKTVSAGIYYLVIKATGQLFTKKITLVK